MKQTKIALGEHVVLDVPSYAMGGYSHDNDVPMGWSSHYNRFITKLPIDVLGPPGTTVTLHGEGVAGGAVYFDHGIGDVATSVTLTVEGQAGGQGFSGVIAVDTVGIYDVVAEFEGQSSVVRLGLCRNVIPFQ